LPRLLFRPTEVFHLERKTARERLEMTEKPEWKGGKEGSGRHGSP
jgi:hypothetical protein